jgi:hypothetical protein
VTEPKPLSPEELSQARVHWHGESFRRLFATLDAARAENAALREQVRTLREALEQGYMMVNGKAYIRSHNGIAMAMDERRERIVRRALAATEPRP